MDRFQEVSLKRCLEYGIGMVHDGMTKAEINLMKQLFTRGLVRLLVATQGFCWEMQGM